MEDTESRLIVAEGVDLKQETLELPEISISDFLDFDKLTFNDQGTAQWYKNKYNGFEDHVYKILEMYSRGGIRYKQYRNHLKKLKKKGKLILQDRTPDAVLAFEKINFTTEDSSVHNGDPEHNL